MLGFKLITKREYNRLVALQKEISPLADLYILRAQSYPCDKCNVETGHCRKLHFADRTICVIDRKNFKKNIKVKKSNP